MAEPVQARGPRRVALVDTGGTIGAIKKGQTAHLAGRPMPVDWLGEDLGDVEIILNVPYRIFSENAHTQHWIVLARTIATLINAGVDGVVVMHGTDTLAYAAAALSFMLQPLPVPVIFTGAMLPANDPETDGPQNLRWSVKAALDPRTPREVCVMFGGGSRAITAYYAGLDNFRDVYGSDRLEQILIRGTRVRKVSAWVPYFKPAERRYAAFQSIHADIIAAVPAANELIYSPTFDVHPSTLAPTVVRHMVPHISLDTRVLLLHVYPGIDPDLLVHMVKRRHYRGIILEAYGDGALPCSEDYSLLRAIGIAVKLGACVGVTTSVLGAVTMEMYPGGKEAIKLGAVPLLDMTYECATVKLMWLLGQHYDLPIVQAQMQRSLVGEVTTYKFAEDV